MDIPAGSAADIDRAVAAARVAQPSWAARSGADRSEILHGVAEALERNIEELIAVELADTGKTPGQARVELDMSAAYFRYYAGILRAIGGRTIDIGASAHVYTKLVPFGVVGIITPWNFPLNQACRGAAPALAVGNAVVLKPSELTPVSTLLLGRLASESGLPPGVLNVVTGTGPNAGEPLAAHPDVQRVAFTGSVATGRHLAQLVAARLVPMTLELGGKSPQVVFADAELDRAIAAAVSTLTFNAGQACSAATRLLVEESVHQEVAARLIEAVQQLRPGIDFGPLITEAQYEKVMDAFERASATDLVPAVGGGGYSNGPLSRGRYVQPTVYVGVDPQAALARDEIFGPVLVTMPFRDEQDAVRLANDTDYGLVGNVWSGDVARGMRVAERIDAGQVSVNGGPLTIETPFGGFKESGYGREKGIEALLDYSHTKTISLSLS